MMPPATIGATKNINQRPRISRSMTQQNVGRSQEVQHKSHMSPPHPSSFTWSHCLKPFKTYEITMKFGESSHPFSEFPTVTLIPSGNIWHLQLCGKDAIEGAGQIQGPGPLLYRVHLPAALPAPHGGVP